MYLDRGRKAGIKKERKKDRRTTQSSQRKERKQTDKMKFPFLFSLSLPPPAGRELPLRHVI